MHQLARIFFSSTLLFILAGFLNPRISGAQETKTDTESSLPLSSEASAYLIDTKIGDSDVDLIWDGYWRMSLVTGGSFGKKTADSTFPGLAQGTSFIQEPDITLTLWLNNRWFLETSFLEGFERNTYRAGYVGEEDEFVRSVVAGNSGVNAVSYAEIDVPSPRFNTPGISASFATERSKHEILLRYDPTESASKTFRGQYEVKSSDIGLGEFVQGQYFILPDTGVSNVRVYLEDRLGSISGTDPDGTVRRYRLAEPAEFFVDSETGFVELAEPHGSRVVAYYAVGASPVGDATLGAGFIVDADIHYHPDLTEPISYRPFDFEVGTSDPYDPENGDFRDTSRVSLPVGDALVLYDPGRFTPFERQNVYTSPLVLPQETWRTTPLLQERGALYPESSADEIEWAINPDDRIFSAYGHTSTTEADLRHPANRYPFALADPEAYGPGRETDPGKLSRIIVLAVREGNPGYYLGTGVVTGSVSVLVNGVQDKTIEVSESGSVSFRRYVFPEDWIEISYRTESVNLDGGDLFIYQGNQFNLRPGLTLELAESVRWNLNSNRSTDDADDSPGEIRMATTLDWETDRASLRLTGEGSLSTPNTAGNLRLFGMDGSGLGLVYFDTSLFEAPATLPAGSAAGGTRIDADRFNYISYDTFGRPILNDYLWSGATDTGNDGPGLAAERSGDPSDGRVMDLRFNMANTEWTAGDALADLNGPINLSSYTGLELPIQFIDDYGPNGWGSAPPAPNVFLQAGEIGESADHHDDGTINSANTSLSVEWNLNTDTDTTGQIDSAWAAPGTWQTLHITLSPDDRRRLSSVRSFRLVIENLTGADVSGRAILGTPRFEGSSFRAEVRSPEPGNVLVADQDVAADEVDSNDLKSAYGEVADLFHPDGETNRALRVRWGTDVSGGQDLGTATATDDRWEAASWFDGVPLEDYRSIVFYVKSNQSGAGSRLTARATDENNLGIIASWEPVNTEWDRITVNFAEGTAVSAHGAVVNVSVNKNTGELTRFVLSGTDETNDATGLNRSGTVYLDEIHFSDPVYSLTGGAEIQAEWRYEEDVASLGDIPILGNITLGGRSSVAGGKFLSGLDRTNLAIDGTFSVSADIIGVGLSTDWQLSSENGNRGWAGSHRLRIPARSSVFWITDSYERADNAGGTGFSRRNELALRLDPGGVNSYSETTYDGLTTIQTWGGDSYWSGGFWKTNLAISYTLNSDTQPDISGGYFNSWILDYVYLLPADGGVSGRDASHRLGTSFTWGPVSLFWNPELRMTTVSSPIWSQENYWSGTLSMPVKFNRDWTLTPSYRRYLRQKVNLTSDNDFDEMWGLMTGKLTGAFPLFTYLPFRELFGSRDGEKFASLTENLSEADYESEFGLNLSRRSGSKLTDLIIPSSADLSIERDYQRKGDTVGWENIWYGSLNFNALNLFGRFGRYPVFDFYNSEQLSGLLQLTLQDYNGTPVPAPEELTWQNTLSFSGNLERRFSLDHRISWHWDSEERETREEATIQYEWRTASQNVLRLPLVKRAIPRQHHLENTERLILNGEYPWKDSPTENEFNLSFTLYHESKWVFQDTGHLKAWAALGLGDRDGMLINGFELGLEAEFRF